MKKLLLTILVVAALSPVTLAAQPTKGKKTSVTLFQATDGKAAEIKFETLNHNFGTIAEADGPVKCSFKFTNTGEAPLVIHQAIASCGCTEPSYPKDPIKPGESGTIDVTYNGKGKLSGHFRKTVTVRTNAKEDVVRLIIEGDMTVEK